MQSPYVCTYTILLLPFEYIESIITINIYICCMHVYHVLLRRRQVCKSIHFCDDQPFPLKHLR